MSPRSCGARGTCSRYSRVPWREGWATLDVGSARQRSAPKARPDRRCWLLLLWPCLDVASGCWQEQEHSDGEVRGEEDDGLALAFLEQLVKPEVQPGRDAAGEDVPRGASTSPQAGQTGQNGDREQEPGGG